MLPLYSRIEDLCVAKGINVTQMCKETGIARAILSDYKTGRKKSIGVSHLEKMAAFFQVSIDYLVTGGAQREKAPPVSTEEALRIYAEGRKGGELTTEELSRLDNFAETFIKGLKE